MEWLGLVGVLVGGVLAIAGGLVGSLIESRRRRAAWVREVRFPIYVEYLRTITNIGTELLAGRDPVPLSEQAVSHAGPLNFVAGPEVIAALKADNAGRLIALGKQNPDAEWRKAWLKWFWGVANAMRSEFGGVLDR